MFYVHTLLVPILSLISRETKKFIPHTSPRFSFLARFSFFEIEGKKKRETSASLAASRIARILRTASKGNANNSTVTVNSRAATSHGRRAAHARTRTRGRRSLALRLPFFLGTATDVRGSPRRNPSGLKPNPGPVEKEGKQVEILYKRRGEGERVKVTQGRRVSSVFVVT